MQDFVHQQYDSAPWSEARGTMTEVATTASLHSRDRMLRPTSMHQDVPCSGPKLTGLRSERLRPDARSWC